MNPKVLALGIRSRLVRNLDIVNDLPFAIGTDQQVERYRVAVPDD
jgi:hypothetical protein